MSGAEAWAAVGLAANVLQIIGFAGDVAGRLKWVFDEAKDARNVPKVVKEVQISLPALGGILANMGLQIQAMAPINETGGAFFERYKPVKGLILACQDDLTKLENILPKVVPAEDAGTRKKLMAVWAGLRKDRKLEEILGRLKSHMDLIKMHQGIVLSEWERTQLDELSKNTQGSGPVGTKIDQLAQAMHAKMDGITLPIEEMNDVVDEISKGQIQNQAVLVHKLDVLINLYKTADIKPALARRDVQTGFNNIPIGRRVSQFVDRPKIILEVKEKFADQANSKRTVVLQGMGGNGKTQLAIDFAVKALDQKSFDSVFWVDATSEASALRSFQEIAEKLTHPAPKFENDRARIEFVERKLKEWDSDFLMVLDNYDDVGAFKTHKLPTFMPHCRSGHFLMTSRLSPYDPELNHLCTFVVEVGGMEENEAEDLLVRRAFRHPPALSGDQSMHAKAIVHRLGCHALAIDLSAAYILKQNLELGLFLEHYDKRKQKILSEAPMWAYQKKVGNQEQATNLAVFTSWELSYKLLLSDENEGKAPACLLNLLAFLYKQGVSEDIFYWNHKSLFNKEDEFPPWLQLFVDDEDQWDSMKFGDAVSDLRKRSLISSFERKGTSIKAITLHPLVKDWIKMRLGTENGPSEEQRRLTVETTNLVHTFLKSQKSTVETFEMTVELKSEALSYVVACQENLTEFCRGNRRVKAKRLGEGELADAGETFALFFEYMGKINEAEALFETLIDWREANSIPEAPALLRAKSLFTEILRLQKNFREAERWDRKVYETRMDLLKRIGVNVLDRATFEKADLPTQELMKDALWTTHDLGWDLEALGDVEEAERLQRDAYEGRRQILGENNALTLQSANNLAHTLRRQGKTLEALALMKETLRIGRDVFRTPHHSELLQFYGNVQDVLRFQASLSEAEDMAQQSLKMTCAEWGEDHPKAAASRGQLKDILWDRNKAEPAEDIARLNLKIMEKSPYSTDISRIDDIALLLDTLSGRQMTDGEDKRGEILKYAEEALELVKGLPEESLKLPSTLQDLIYLATGLEVLRASKQLTKLEPTIFKHCKDVFGISDRNAINSLVRLSSALRVEGKEDEARQVCQDAINELQAKLKKGDKQGPKSTHLAALSWLAVLYKHIGDQGRAMEVYDRAFDYVNQGDFIATADYETLYSIQGLAEDIDDQRRCQKAEILHRAVLQTRREKYGRHPCVDDSLYAYSWNLRLQDRLMEAEKICLEALSIAREFRGPHRNTMCILKRLAYLEEQLGQHAEAEKHYREVLNGFRALGTRHLTRVTEALEDLQELLMEQRKWEEARDLIKDAMKRREAGWDRNMGHYAGLIRHLAIVTWEIGDGVEGLKLYREARRTYEKAWGLKQMKEGRAKQNLIRRINELLPGTENMEEEMRVEEEQRREQAEKEHRREQAALDANDAAIQRNADLDPLDDGQKTPTAVHEVKASLHDIQQQMGPSHVGWDGATQSYQVSTKDYQEATVENGGLSLSRQTTLGTNSLPEAPSHEPSKLNETSANLDEVTRRMEQASLG